MTYNQMRASALRSVRSGDRFEDVAARYGYTAFTIQRWAKQAGVYRGFQKQPTYIYGLQSPIDGLIYYVGKSNRPKARLYLHLQRPTNSYMGDWIASLAAEGHKPVVVIVARITENVGQWRGIEQQFIAKYKEIGHPLLNIEVAGWSGEPMKKARAARWPKKEKQS